MYQSSYHMTGLDCMYMTRSSVAVGPFFFPYKKEENFLQYSNIKYKLLQAQPT